MGSGASMSRKEIRKRESARHSMLKSVEKFVVNVYATCPRLEAMILILSSERASVAFRQFLTSEKANENIENYSVNIGKRCRTANHDGSKVQKTTEIIFSFDQDYNDIVDAINVILKKIQDECVYMMARDQFFRFLQSKYYKKWRSTESSHAIAHTVEDVIGVDIREKPLPLVPATKQKSIRTNRLSMTQSPDSFSIRERVSKDRDSFSYRDNIAVGAFTSIDTSAMNKILAAKSWISCLLAAVEALPLCFSLSIVRKEKTNFPFVFVNNYFKKKTGFENKDILGKSYNFLTIQNSDKSSLDELYKSLQVGEKACTIIETRKADNMPYSTLIAVKPISSEKKKLLYVITLYLDVTRDENHSVRLSLVSELLDMLPQFMMVDSEDPDDTGCLFKKHH